jgi:cation diffusion facilitator family transporter
MSPQRRSALVSVGAAATLVVLKLSIGLATHSLGLISEAAHSGTDFVAALLTYFAIRVSARPADVAHQFGHSKAEHLSALAEAGFLVLVSLFISLRAIERLVGSSGSHVHVRWYALVVVGVVILIDASRTLVSWRTSRRFESAALASNAIHFASDLLGSIAVLVGLLFAQQGHPNGDPIAALFVGALVLLGASRLIKVNVDVLMDSAPADAEAVARDAIDALSDVQLRRLRMRQAGGRQFADVVIGVPREAGVGQGHAAASAVEAAVEGVLPNADVVVHVEPLDSDATLRERAHAAAIGVQRVREVHNIALVEVDGRTELSLHVKLPGDLSLDEAHDIAEQLEDAIRAAIPELAGVQTHLEPLTETSEAREAVSDGEEVVRKVVREATGAEPRELRFLRTTGGLVAFLTLGLEGTSSLAEAHARASEIEERIRRERPDIADVIVHTEP